MMSSDPLISVMALSLGITAIFAILISITAAAVLFFSNRTFGAANSQNRDFTEQRIKALEARIAKLETQNAELTAKNLELAMRNNELATMLKAAQNEMIKMQEQIWNLQNHDADTTG